MAPMCVPVYNLESYEYFYKGISGSFNFVNLRFLVQVIVFPAICKSRHWNLGIGIENGIGIGTDITNAIISSSIRSMDPKLSRMVT